MSQPIDPSFTGSSTSSSNSSTRGTPSTTEPFAYQARLLDKSLSRATAQRPTTIFTPPVGATRRWMPHHRPSASVDAAQRLKLDSRPRLGGPDYLDGRKSPGGFISNNLLGDPIRRSPSPDKFRPAADLTPTTPLTESMRPSPRRPVSWTASLRSSGAPTTSTPISDYSQAPSPLNPPDSISPPAFKRYTSELRTTFTDFKELPPTPPKTNEPTPTPLSRSPAVHSKTWGYAQLDLSPKLSETRNLPQFPPPTSPTKRMASPFQPSAEVMKPGSSAAASLTRQNSARLERVRGQWEERARTEGSFGTPPDRDSAQTLPTVRTRRSYTLESTKTSPRDTFSSTTPSLPTTPISLKDPGPIPATLPATTPARDPMSPTPYRSSFMKKRGAYAPGLGIGRKLGQHLPRIASGDGNENWEEEEARERARERRKRERERYRAPSPPPPASPAPDELVIPGITTAPDVQGVPGRLRLSRENNPTTPVTSPLPSARLGMYGLWADKQRHLLQAYEYLCHVGEAQQWIEGCLGEELGFGVVEMEQEMRNGVVLAKLARVWEGEGAVRRIFEHPKLQYRHSDNIHIFLVFVRRVKLPECFIFELTDLYEKKNFPKVVYCIHALSHLLARRGMAQKIGNLLGRLKFSDDQLQQTQRGLNAAGVSMPNFGNVGKELAKEINEEPEVEEETEDERINRLLHEEVGSITAFQSTARRYLAQKAVATKHARMRLAERSIVKLQARARGLIVRQSIVQSRRDRSRLVPWAISLQAAARAVLTRRAWRARVLRIRAAQRQFVKVQAQARGVLERRKYARLKTALRSTKFSIMGLQAVARAKIARRTHQEATKKLEVPIVVHGVVGLQSMARALLVKKKAQKQVEKFAQVQMNIVGMQAHLRGALIRKRVRNQLAKLDDAVDVVVRIQAACREFLARQRLLALIRGLRAASPMVVGLQARAKANLARKAHKELSKAFAVPQTAAVVNSVQSLARAALVRKRQRDLAKRLDFAAPDVTGLQAAARGALVRNDYWAWRDHLHNSQDEVIYLQALFRGLLERRRFRAKMEYYHANLDKVIKIQSLFRAKEQREQYRQLTMGQNVNVGTIKNFVHLLDDSEADFEDEIEVERLRKKVVESIRDNQALENDVNELDVKIALVVQNVKSFEELIRARRRHGAESAAAHAARASVLAAHGDPFAGPNTLDQATKRKLELYQQLFYLLQTKSEYLARLFFLLSRGSVPEKNARMAERVVLTLFGYGQDRREDYLLLKLFQLAIHEEVKAATTVDEMMQEKRTYLNVAVHYVRPKQVAFVRDILQVAIKEVIEQEDLDLETDPVVIYRTRINEEEMRSGRVSNKKKDVSYYEAVIDPETRPEFIQHLRKLQVLTNVFVHTLTTSTKKMPYGMRCIAREILIALKIKFPDQPDEVYAAALGKLIFNRYIKPAILNPETFDIVPNTIGAIPRKNLAEICKMLGQISTGLPFGDEEPCLQPVNTYVSEAIVLFNNWFMEVADVPDAETHYHAHEFLDVTVQPKPIYISPNEVYSMHSLLAQHLDVLASDRADPLRAIIHDLDGVPNIGTEDLKDARDRAITLELTNRFASVKDPHADEKALWVQAKRGVLAILRVQPAKDLVDSLMAPVKDEHEILWEDIVDNEIVTDRKIAKERRMPSTTGADSAYRLQDIRSLSFREVKAHAIFFLLELEKRGLVSRTDGYQGVLNAIAGDVRSKHRKRLHRQNEMKSMNQALSHLAEQKKFFEEQVNSYHSYIDSAMVTMQKGKGKKRFVMPFTKQYFHLRELQKAGKNPQFGSYKYSAQDLYDKGILLSIDQFSPRQFDRIDIVISSNQVGIFEMEATNSASGTSVLFASTEMRMEDLLQAQFENRVSLPLFDPPNVMRFNLNLLLYQINKKFYV
ncbi:hypothetical protein BOTBODRAFT_172359 [Botryobasidium botryosum FD-172 SS1]|uniref:Ras-GAP domain-containing protein n=1 Tax=Botryobasidium botryosum (strain FD-172 SS1) TaxID=930990 RepID=A0A067N0P6_BOTB1|nr:hypothetical protein BOTBODRAFT_172359 [Botryobasidium botryosum FD-172 SS1]